MDQMMLNYTKLTMLADFHFFKLCNESTHESRWDLAVTSRSSFTSLMLSFTSADWVSRASKIFWLASDRLLCSAWTAGYITRSWPSETCPWWDCIGCIVESGVVCCQEPCRGDWLVTVPVGANIEEFALEGCASMPPKDSEKPPLLESGLSMKPWSPRESTVESRGLGLSLLGNIGSGKSMAVCCGQWTSTRT